MRNTKLTDNRTYTDGDMVKLGVGIVATKNGGFMSGLIHRHLYDIPNPGEAAKATYCGKPLPLKSRTHAFADSFDVFVDRSKAKFSTPEGDCLRCSKKFLDTFVGE